MSEEEIRELLRQQGRRLSEIEMRLEGVQPPPHLPPRQTRLPPSREPLEFIDEVFAVLVFAGIGSLIGLIIEPNIKGLVWGAGIATLALSIFLFGAGELNRGLLFCDGIGFIIGLAKTKAEWPLLSEKVSNAIFAFWRGEPLFYFSEIWNVIFHIIFNFLLGITICVIFLFFILLVGRFID